MKKLFVLFILALSLSACMGAPAQPAYNCGEGVCTQLQVVEPVRPNQPVTVIITVAADKDLPGLGVSLYYDGDAEVEGPQHWEKDAKDGKVWQGGASWSATAKAKQPLHFTRKIRPPSWEGIFHLA